MAVGALRALAPGHVMMMCCAVELRRRMTLRAHGVAFGAQLAAMRLVAIAAGDACRVHLALQERTPVVDFVALLPIGMVERRAEQRRPVVIEERLAGRVTVGDLPPP